MVPKDPVMLLSYINTQLRDFYPNLEEGCRSLSVKEEEVKEKLAMVDYYYDDRQNQFV